MTTRVRELEAAEWTLWRELRMEALADSPDSFGVTLAAARSQSEADWIEYSTPSRYRRLVVAESDEGPVGMAALRILEDLPDQAMLYSMWVRPGSRRTGVGGVLLDRALDMAREAGVQRVALHLTNGNDAAERLYLRAGFVSTGETEPLRPGSPLMTTILAADLTGRSAASE